MKEHSISHITDLLSLNEEEFARMLPDLCLWWRAAKAVQEIPGAKNTGFVWVDDGAPGITGYQATDPATGKTTRVELRTTP